MKKIIALLIIISIAGTIFAGLGSGVGDSYSSSSELTLTLNSVYEFAFIKSDQITNIDQPGLTVLDTFNLKTKGGALTSDLELDEESNVFYFFYHAYTNMANLAIKISAPDSLTKSDDLGQKIAFNVSLATEAGKWDGDALSSYSFDSGTASSYSTALIRNSSISPDKFNYSGLCKITVNEASGVNLWEKKPGNYRTNIYLTLITT